MAEITLKDVSVAYPILHQRSRSLVNAVTSATVGGSILRDSNVTIRALENISLSLGDGDRLGILGHNGAGKTTLLKTIGGILPPTAGRLRVTGRVSTLTSMGLGLDGEASGYENIKIRARIMGYNEDEIEAVLPEIVEFTELGEFLSLPLKSYSSGMRMRLTFATSTAFRPDVLLLDEWLSTGDMEFRQKATQRLKEHIRESGIFVFASHNRDLHRAICTKGAILDHGKMIFFGELNEAFEREDAMQQGKHQAAQSMQ